jgi:hypothetical protein
VTNPSDTLISATNRITLNALRDVIKEVYDFAGMVLTQLDEIETKASEDRSEPTITPE